MAYQSSYSGMKFINTEVMLDDRTFEKCEFKDCVLLFAGGGLPRFSGDNQFHNCSFKPVGAAENTLNFLGMIAKGGGDGSGKDMVSSIFRQWGFEIK